MDDDSHEVQLYIYDISQGISAMMSGLLLGRHIEGIWHTAIVAYGREYFYGSGGIQSCPPGGTVLGQPLKIETLGYTCIPYSVFRDYIGGLAESEFIPSLYNLIKHNCNNFTDELSQFLCGKGIPKYILELPSEFLSTQLGQTLAPIIDSIGAGINPVQSRYTLDSLTTPRQESPGFQELISEVERARQQSAALDEKRKAINHKIAKKEKKKEKKSKKSKSERRNSSSANATSNSGMSEVEAEISTVASEAVNGDGGADGGASVPVIPSEMLPSEQVLEDEAREKREEEERKKLRDPPVVFKEIDAKTELEALVKLVDGQLSKEEEQSVSELHQYLLEGEGAWAISENFLTFAGRLLRDPAISTETRVHLLRAMAKGAMIDDIILLLHQDRRDHILMNYAQDIDRHKPEEQQALALFVCNLFENTNSSEWLLYISEWTYNNQQTSNIRATTKVAVHCLLAACPTLQDIGTAIVHNLACKEVKTVVFDDIAVEVTMAILQFFSASKPEEKYLYRTMKALSRFVTVSPEIPQFIQMIGPEPRTFKGASERVDELIDQIQKKLR